MNILIAPNAFKNSLNAIDVANAISEGFIKSNLPCNCECFPIGDGGDGTGNLLINKFNGSVITNEVQDPFGRKILASFGLIDNDCTAIIEMASASGLGLLKVEELDPLSASSFGTGELIMLALNRGVTKIILAVGGSATVDGGAGILAALGLRFFTGEGNELACTPAELINLSTIDVSNLDARALSCEFIILADVDNPLLGEHGAAAVFGPQKGADPERVKKLESMLTTFANVSFQQTGVDIRTCKYGGAAGGISAGLYAFLNAKLVNGIDYFLKVTGFDDALQRSDLLITGEGSLDEQTLQGKGPFGVALRAKAMNVPVIGLAGRIPLNENEQLQSYFNVLLSIGNEPTNFENALTNTTSNLVRTSMQIGNLLALTK